MKNTIKVLGIITIIALIGCIFTACEEEEKEKNGITISGTPKIGNKITAKISGKYLSGPRWELSVDGTDWRSMIDEHNYPFGTNVKEITIPSIVEGYLENGNPETKFSPEGNFIRAFIYLDYSVDSTVYSNVLGPIEP
jgi:hypothetical protein